MIARSFRALPQGFDSFEALVFAAKLRMQPGSERRGDAALTELFARFDENLQFVASQSARSVGRGHDECFIEDCLGDAREGFIRLLDALDLERLPAETLRSAFFNDHIARMVRAEARRRIAPLSITSNADRVVNKVRRHEQSLGRPLNDKELAAYEMTRTTLAAARAALEQPISLEARDAAGNSVLDTVPEEVEPEGVHDLEAVMAVFNELPARFQFVLEAYCGRHGEQYAGSLAAVARLASEVAIREIGERRIRQWFAEIMVRMRGRLGCGTFERTGISVDERSSSDMWDVLLGSHLEGFVDEPPGDFLKELALAGYVLCTESSSPE